MKTFVHSDGTLILVTVISVLIIALIVGNAYIPILMGGELFSESFKERNLAPQNLSRTLEDAGPVPFLWFRGQREARICRERWESLRSHMLRGQSFVTQVFVLRFSGALPGLESRN